MLTIKVAFHCGGYTYGDFVLYGLDLIFECSVYHIKLKSPLKMVIHDFRSKNGVKKKRYTDGREDQYCRVCKASKCK